MGDVRATIETCISDNRIAEFLRIAVDWDRNETLDAQGERSKHHVRPCVIHMELLTENRSCQGNVPKGVIAAAPEPFSPLPLASEYDGEGDNVTVLSSTQTGSSGS